MKLVSVKDDIIRTRAEYSVAFRFRLWVALVEDMDLLNMGHRAYHSHVMDSFSVWRARGFRFENYKGRELNIEALKVDDVYGFQGKKNQAPLGPKRNIEPAKVSVLYAFFSRKYPDLAASFDKEAPLTELTSILRSFFRNEHLTNLSLKRLSEICEEGDGIFIPRVAITADELRATMKKGGPLLRSVPVYIVCSNPKRDFCIVHRVEYPLCSSYLKMDSTEYANLERLRTWVDRHGAEETIVFSGIGLPVVSEFDSGNPTLLCILRDRVLYRPFTSELEIMRVEEGGDFEDPYWLTVGARERSGQDIWRRFIFCRDQRQYDMISDEISFTAKFIEDIFNLKTSLGMEI